MAKQPNEPDELLSTYVDKRSREWELGLNYVLLEVIQRETGCKLGNVETLPKTWAALLYDDVLCLKVVWLAVGGDPQDNTVRLAGETIDRNDWLAAINGDVLEEARVALRNAIENFTPPEKRKMLLLGMKAVDEGYRAAIREAETNLKKLTSSVIERGIAEVRRGMRGLKSPASSASSTIAGRSGRRTRR